MISSAWCDKCGFVMKNGICSNCWKNFSLKVNNIASKMGELTEQTINKGGNSMSIKVENTLTAYSELGLYPKQTSNMIIKSAWNTNDYVEINLNNVSVFVKACDLISAINNATNNNHLR